MIPIISIDTGVFMSPISPIGSDNTAGREILAKYTTSPRATAIIQGHFAMVTTAFVNLVSPVTTTIPIVHTNILNIVRNAVAYRSPSCPNIAFIRGNPIYPALENIQANLVIFLLSVFIRDVTAKDTIKPITRRSVLYPNALIRLALFCGSYSIV